MLLVLHGHQVSHHSDVREHPLESLLETRRTTGKFNTQSRDQEVDLKPACNWESLVQTKAHVCRTCAERLFLFRLFSFLLRRTPVSLERPKPLLTLDSLDWVVGATASPRLMHFFSYTGTTSCRYSCRHKTNKGKKMQHERPLCSTLGDGESAVYVWSIYFVSCLFKVQ